MHCGSELCTLLYWSADSKIYYTLNWLHPRESSRKAIISPAYNMLKCVIHQQQILVCQWFGLSAANVADLIRFFFKNTPVTSRRLALCCSVSLCNPFLIFFSHFLCMAPSLRGGWPTVPLRLGLLQSLKAAFCILHPTGYWNSWVKGAARPYVSRRRELMDQKLFFPPHFFLSLMARTQWICNEIW